MGLWSTSISIYIAVILLAAPIVANKAIRTLNNEPFIGCLDNRDTASGYILGVKCRGVSMEFVGNHLTQLNVNEIIELDCLQCKMSTVLSFNQSIARIRLSSSEITTLAADAFRNSNESLAELDLSNNKLAKFPTAIQNLTELEVLDLSNNNLTTLPEGTQFFHLWKLRSLDLGHNRLGTIQEIQERLARDSGKPLSLSVFNLEPLRELLEILSLRDNKLKVLPEQFSRHFPRLRRLDLSANQIEAIPHDSFTSMPDLQFLNLENNRIRILRLSPYPSQIKILSLLGNPLICKCPAAFSEKPSSNRTIATYSSCIDGSSNVKKNYDFMILPDIKEHCSNTVNETEEKPTTTEKIPKAPESNRNNEATRLTLKLESESRSVAVTWKVNRTSNGSEGFSWRILCRKFGTKNYTEVTGTQSRGALSSGTVKFPALTPSTGYVVCFEYASTEDERQTVCEEIITEEEDAFPSSEVAIAATVSTTSTMVVIALVCCCCPCSKRKKKEEKIPETVTKRKKSVEYSYPTLSAKYKNLSEGYKRNCVLFPEDFSYTNFSSIDSAVKEEESRRVFEETKKYLQNERVKAILNHEERIPEALQSEVKVKVECHENEDSTSSGYLTPKTNDEIDATLNYDLFKPKDTEPIISPEMIQKRLSIVESLQNYKEPMPKLPISPKKRNSIEMTEISVKRRPPLHMTPPTAPFHITPPAPRVVSATYKRAKRHHTWSSVPVEPPSVRWNREAYEKFLANPSVYKRKRRHTLYNAPPYMTVNRMYLVAHPSGEIRF